MKKSSVHYLFLYTRLPNYFLKCIEYLLNESPSGSKALIICYPTDNNAPHEYEIQNEHIQIIGKKDISSVDLENWNPNVIYISGWGDRLYNQLARSFIKEIPVIIGLDNPWKGSFRQRIGTLLATLFLKGKCSHLWVAGYPQYEFARRLNFPPDKILKGLYVADIEHFKNQSLSYSPKIVFVGRIVKYKRPDWILEAFVEIRKLKPSFLKWELIMIGNGPMQESLKTMYESCEGIKFINFVQPKELINYYHNASIFCMPSHQEHWGLVVQEAAASGLALLLSDTCGAASEFLINGYNGYVFKSKDKVDFKNCLQKLMEMPEEEMIYMKNNSVSMANRLDANYWSANLKSVLHGI